MSLEARLKRIEGYQSMKVSSAVILHVGSRRDIQNEDQLEEELKKPKYKGRTVIIDDIALAMERM